MLLWKGLLEKGAYDALPELARISDSAFSSRFLNVK
jgi:hypothetical protein